MLFGYFRFNTPCTVGCLSPMMLRDVNVGAVDPSHVIVFVQLMVAVHYHDSLAVETRTQCKSRPSAGPSGTVFWIFDFSCARYPRLS